MKIYLTNADWPDRFSFDCLFQFVRMSWNVISPAGQIGMFKRQTIVQPINII